MHGSSESIGRIAAALALAQKQLQNPVKTLLATIPSPFPREDARSFRYASLASGLEIIRKALGEHEIATIQCTSLDKELSLIRLNTVLAHSSGEWISSDWPVCATNEVVAPHRLGAALAYARRYALFTIVGIAGEDDLDAPGLSAPSEPSPPSGAVPWLASRPFKAPALVPPERSRALRDQLLSELAPLRTVEDLTLWALRRLTAKNTLQEEDAKAINVAYLGKLDIMQGDTQAREAVAPDVEPTREPASEVLTTLESRELTQSAKASKAVIPLPKTLRRRNKTHLVFVATQPCMVCKRTPCDAHHLKFTQPRAMGRKVSDEFTVPLCREHHSDLHRHGNERAWWSNLGLSPLIMAVELWAVTQKIEAIADADSRRERKVN